MNKIEQRYYFLQAKVNKERVKRASKLKKKQPLSSNQARRLEIKKLIDNQFSCAICNITFNDDPRNRHADHCHETGNLRELLCRHCNVMLGQARDSVQILEWAIIYLKKHKAKEIIIMNDHNNNYLSPFTALPIEELDSLTNV